MDLLRMLILLAVVGVVAFFLVQIGLVLYKRMNETNELREHLVGAQYVPNMTQLDNPSGPTYQVPLQTVEQGPVAPSSQKGRANPDIPGQSDDEVRRPEPLQRHVRRQPAEEPEAAEALPQRQEEATFTEDLRHPEASFQPHPFNKRSMPVDSGVASKVSSPGLADQQPFESDLAQNGGEWIKGAFAFDSTENNGFSPLF
jgi:hypothetical protein